ncbi:MAG: 4Fe-4S binding protein [Rhodospirillales bacterium]|nr:4Fe-4S binding protein [Rhodospirillales bacterium]
MRIADRSMDRRGFLFGRSRAEASALIAAIDDSCLALGGVVCRVCEEQCDARAVRVRLAVGGGSSPTVEPALCTGCGACVAPCPTRAIAIRPAGDRHIGR